METTCKIFWERRIRNSNVSNDKKERIIFLSAMNKEMAKRKKVKASTKQNKEVSDMLDVIKTLNNDFQELHESKVMPMDIVSNDELPMEILSSNTLPMELSFLSPHESGEMGLEDIIPMRSDSPTIIMSDTIPEQSQCQRLKKEVQRKNKMIDILLEKM